VLDATGMGQQCIPEMATYFIHQTGLRRVYQMIYVLMGSYGQREEISKRL